MHTHPNIKKGLISMIIYTVAPGDTIDSIAAQYGIPAERLILDNNLNDKLSIGQSIVIAYHSKVHTVTEGDTLQSIATRYGITLNKLYRNNPNLNGREIIYPGQTLIIEYSGKKSGELSVVGYVYTFVEESTLRRTLPYLTYLAIFSYGINADGSLIVPQDENLISLALKYGVKPMLVLTSLTEDGIFSTERISQVLNNHETLEKLISNIVETMNIKGYAAINSDFEYISASDREAYVDFISSLRSELEPFGKTVDVSLAPKTSDGQTGLLYEGIDYSGLGKAADSVFLMTYEWGYKYSEPRAVAPLPSVTQVVDYALGVIPKNKILMGIPNYGYDWNIPWVEGRPAITISNSQAINLANEHNAEIFFNETAKSPWFNYFDNIGNPHEVWFEDARSIKAKLELAASSELLGVGVWNVTNWFSQLWFVLNLLYDIRK